MIDLNAARRLQAALNKKSHSSHEGAVAALDEIGAAAGDLLDSIHEEYGLGEETAEPQGPRTIREWQKAIHEYAKSKGWWDTPRAIGDIFILFTSEVAEAYEEYRNGHEVTETYFDPEKPDKPEGVPTELADVIIRILDFAEWAGIDLQAIMERKHAYNQKRPYRHGGKRT